MSILEFVILHRWRHFISLLSVATRWLFVTWYVQRLLITFMSTLVCVLSVGSSAQYTQLSPQRFVWHHLLNQLSDDFWLISSVLCSSVFTAQCSCASALLGVVILSVCLSVTRVLCDKTNNALQIFWYHNKEQSLYTVSQKTVQNCFCQNFVKFPPILIIFGRKIAKRLKLCEVHLFFTSPNLRQHTTVLNADVPNCYITL